ncbi:MAG: hypothetical protein K0S37_2393 [Microbacterium sp.]|jgi:NTP pyrophosphatase (non-canonical NTP hydrolase)|nr:hypothetical protein [Microbacterium sp.]
MTELSQAALVSLSEWIDAGNAQRDPEALTLHRLIKLTEESGEVVTATIGALGANPRKGVTNTFEKVLEELLDVAITALGAYEHIDGHQGRALSELDGKIVRVAERAGAITRPSLVRDWDRVLNPPATIFTPPEDRVERPTGEENRG